MSIGFYVIQCPYCHSHIDENLLLENSEGFCSICGKDLLRPEARKKMFEKGVENCMIECDKCHRKKPEVLMMGHSVYSDSHDYPYLCISCYELWTEFWIKNGLAEKCIGSYSEKIWKQYFEGWLKNKKIFNWRIA